MSLDTDISTVEITDVDIVPYEEEGNDEDTRTHIVNPPKNLHIWTPGMTSREMVSIARMTGQHVVALCDYSWVPKRNPENYKACDTCMTIAQQLMSGMGE